MTPNPHREAGAALPIDSGMSGDAVAEAEAFWANLPAKPWTSLSTHEKALVCHQIARLKALALEASHHAELVRIASEWRNDLLSRGYSPTDEEVSRIDALLAKLAGESNG
jgi:hypothetical protein